MSYKHWLKELNFKFNVPKLHTAKQSIILSANIPIHKDTLDISNYSNYT